MMRLLRQSTLSVSVVKPMVVLLVTAGCTRAEAIEKIPTGTEVTVVTQDGAMVRGKIASVESDVVKLTGHAGWVTYDIDTKPLSYVAESTKKDDAVKVGAAAGAVIGASAGTGVVLATDGKEIQLAEGRRLKVSLTNPLTIRTK